MLVLSRRTNEKLIIETTDGVVVVVVTRVKGDTVRLGIDAPRTVRVWRKELHDSAEAEDDSDKRD